MKLNKPIYADIEIKTLLDYGGHLFKSLWFAFPQHTKIERTLDNLYTWDQVNAVVESGYHLHYPEELQQVIQDYIKE